MSFPPIYIINLKRTPERRLHMQRQLDAFNLNYQFVDAVDKNELHSREYRAATAYQTGIDESKLEYFFKDRTTGALACQLSHIKVYNLIIKHKIPMACVLEDDVYLMPVFPKVLVASQEAFWDILMLSHYSRRLVSETGIFEHISNKYMFLYKLMHYKKYYPQINLHMIRLIFLKKVNSYVKRLFAQPRKYDYLSEIGTLPEIEKSSWHKITSRHYIARPHLSNDFIGSGAAYMLTRSAAIIWKEEIIHRHQSLDRIPYILYCNGKINLRILALPCVLLLKQYLRHSARKS